ncbi:MAG: hypothetical protein GY750_14475 [Lentisphaerae bacterium]|nr:hypothetical protein [Lentisphaerota bacterium]
MSNFQELCTKLKAALVADFADEGATVGWLKREVKDLPAPGILLDIEQLDIGEDEGDGRLPLECSFAAFCILSICTSNYELAIKGFVAKVMALLRHNSFGMETVSIPENLSAEGVDFSPGKAGYICWVVTWQQTVYVGEDVWSGDGIIPSEVKFNYTPEVGAEHEAGYESL